MAIQSWSKDILVVDLGDDPQFTEDVNRVSDLVESRGDQDVILNFEQIRSLNSSNIARLLRLRKLINQQNRRLRFCRINTHIWGIFLVTGLDNLFQFVDDKATALADLQIQEKPEQ